VGERKKSQIMLEGGCDSPTSRLKCGERHMDDKGGRLGRRSRLEFEPLRRGLRNRSLPSPVFGRASRGCRKGTVKLPYVRGVKNFFFAQLQTSTRPSPIVSMGKAQKKTGKGRLDKYYKLAKLVSFSSWAERRPDRFQRTRLSSSFGIQAYSIKQEIFDLGVRKMYN